MSNNISNWDLSNIKNMQSMFANSVFNADISKWNISGENLYIKITLIYSFSFEGYKSFSYDKLVGAFFHKSLVYINKFREQCVPFELFNDISKNTDEFNVFLLVDNTYIIEEYLKLSIEEKEQLIKNETMNNFFNEINAIINFKAF